MREGLVRTVTSDPERMARVEAIRVRVEQEFAADTDTPRGAGEFAEILDRFTKPTEQESVPITFDPDDYPLL